MSEGPSDAAGAIAFDLVRRGYDRRQVDEHMAAMATQLGELRVAHQREHRRADRAEGELHNARTELEQQVATSSDGGGAGSQQGFGYRVEKLLRTAESEAAEVRSSAAREATALVERAREDAEAHRHEVAQSLITRSASLDQEAAQRKVELDEQERQLAEQAGAARDEAERMFADATRQSDQLRLEAQARVEQERAAAEKAIRQRHMAAEQELARLRGLHGEVRGQLARLLDSLASEFGMRTHPQPTQPRAQPQAHSQSQPHSQPQPQPQPQAHSQPQAHPQPYPRTPPPQPALPAQSGPAQSGMREKLAIDETHPDSPANKRSTDA